MSTTYTINVKNESKQTGSFCVYQTIPNQDTLNIYSLAWFSKAAHPDVNIAFSWTIDYSFMWAETGVLKNGTTFIASQTLPADPSSSRLNSKIFSHDDDGFFFKDGDSKPLGALSINTDSTIPNKIASLGVGMSGKAALAVDAYSNTSYSFQPHPTYWIAFGDYKQGKVIDVNRMSLTQQFDFPTNIFNRDITFTENNDWIVS